MVGGASLELFQQAKASARRSWERFIAQPAFQRPRNAATVVLEVATAPITVLGQTVVRGCIRQLNGQRGYTTSQADGINLELINQLPVPTTVHWHGLILPNAMDGVPFVTQPPIPPGQRQRIHYSLVQNGTFWMHSHYGLQTQNYVAEPFVILNEEQERWADRTITVMLRDFSFTPASEILNNVVAGERGGGTAMAESLADFDWHQRRKLLTQQWDPASQRFGWKQADGVLMMAPDVVYDALLANERSLDDPEIIDVEPGETVAIRWIAASAFMMPRSTADSVASIAAKALNNFGQAASK